MIAKSQDGAKPTILRVKGGRGFVVAPKWSRFQERYVITAAHCLPKLPPRMSISYTEERTYPKLLGPVEARRRHVWAECVFVDPIADIAVLGSPDSEVFSEEAEAYDRLVETITPLVISDVAEETASAELISLSRQKFRCVVGSVRQRGPFWITDATQEIEGGMSGSPILAENGSAIGVLVTFSGPHPRLASHLPGWLLGDLGIRLSRGNGCFLPSSPPMASAHLDTQTV
jgi:hypothetical protein